MFDNILEATQYQDAAPIFDGALEAATCCTKIVISSSGSFHIAGKTRTAFLVGGRSSPIKVDYSREADCNEWEIPSWMTGPLLGLRGHELSNTVIDLFELPKSPFVNSLLNPKADSIAVGRSVLSNWSHKRGNTESMIAAAAWSILNSDYAAAISSIARHMGISTRRLHHAVTQETGLSPKLIQRLARHEKAAQFVQFTDRTLIQISADLGYADQSHMSRDFKIFSGLSTNRVRQAMRDPS